MADTPQNMVKKVIILVAAGRGSRAGEGLPKQYRAVAGKPLIRRTIEALRRALPGADILPVIHPDDDALFQAAFEVNERPSNAGSGWCFTTGKCF